MWEPGSSASNRFFDTFGLPSRVANGRRVGGLTRRAGGRHNRHTPEPLLARILQCCKSTLHAARPRPRGGTRTAWVVRRIATGRPFMDLELAKPSPTELTAPINPDRGVE